MREPAPIVPEVNPSVRPLEYAVTRTGRFTRIAQGMAQWVSRRSCWSIALAMMVVLIVVDYSEIGERIDRLLFRFGTYWFARDTIRYLRYAAFFLPGAVRRLSWRDALLMAGAAAWVYVIDTHVFGKLEFLFPYGLVYWPVVVVGILEWVLIRPRRVGTLGWVVALMAAVAFIVPSVGMPLEYIWPEGLKIMPRLYLDPSYLAHWTLVAVLTWLAIPAVQRLAVGGNWKSRGIGAFAGIACVAWFAIFFHTIEYRLAARSILHGGPFPRYASIWIMQRRPGAIDDAVYWRCIETADWSVPVDETYSPDYRIFCINTLVGRHPAATAARLTAMLQRRPSGVLAECAAHALAQANWYPAAPELMRYALLDGGKSCAAVEQMGIPQAALARIEDIRDESVPIDPDDEAKLTKLLGYDAGRRWVDWRKLYDDVIDQRPTPLPPAQAAEVARVVQAILDYWRAEIRLYNHAGPSSPPVAHPNLNVPGTVALEQEIQNYSIKIDLALGASAQTRPN